METFLAYLESHVDAAIYVWGAQGENVLAQKDPEGWIRYKETTGRSGYASHKEEYDLNAERAIALFRKRKAAGVYPILAFDCSGLIVHYAFDLYEIIDHDYTAALIYSQLCDKLTPPATIRGQLVFKKKNGAVNHVGVYVGNGQIIECRGRDYGVVKRAYNPDEWQLAGEWPELMAYCVDPQPVSREDNGEKIRALQTALNAFGYTDANYHPLAEDGKYGAKTQYALEHFLRVNMPALKLVFNREGLAWAPAEK